MIKPGVVFNMIISFQPMQYRQNIEGIYLYLPKGFYISIEALTVSQPLLAIFLGASEAAPTNLHHYRDVTWASWRVKSAAIPLLTQQFI